MADVSFGMIGDTSRFQKAMDQAQKEIGKLKEQLAGVRDESRRGGREHGDLIGKATRGVMALAGQYVSLTMGIQKSVEALREYNKAKDEAAQAAATSRPAYGQLAQLAEGKTETERRARYGELIEKAKELYAGGGAGSQAEAAQVVFDLVSAGQESQLGFIRDLRKSGFVGQTGELTKSARALQATMGEAVTGNLKDLLSTALVAAAPAPASAEEVLQGATRGAGAAKLLGVVPAELLATVAKVSEAAGSTEWASTEVAQVLARMIELRQPPDWTKGPMDPKLVFGQVLQGKGLMEMVKEVKGRGLTEGQIQQLFPEERAFRGYLRMAENVEAIEQLTREAQAAPGAGEVEKRMALPSGHLAGEAARVAEEAKARAEVQEEQAGIIRNLTDAAMVDYQRGVMRGELPALPTVGLKAFQSGLAYGAATLDKLIGNDEALAARLRKGMLRGELSPETAIAVSRALNEPLVVADVPIATLPERFLRPAPTPPAQPGAAPAEPPSATEAGQAKQTAVLERIATGMEAGQRKQRVGAAGAQVNQHSE